MLVEWVLTLMAACFDQLLRGLAFGVPELRREDSTEVGLLEGFQGQRNSVEVATVHPEQQRLFFSGVDPCPRNLSSEPSTGTNSPL
jgi:hypothetical protein